MESSDPITDFNGISDGAPFLQMKKEIAETLGVDYDALWGNEYENDPGYRQLILNLSKKNAPDPATILQAFNETYSKEVERTKTYKKYLDMIQVCLNKPASQREEALANLFAGEDDVTFKAYLDDENVSQEFLYRLLQLLYDAAEYRFISDFILDKLPVKKHPKLTILAAHIYGSTQVGEYDKAITLLKDIKEATLDEQTDNKTAMISNTIRRFFIDDPEKEAVCALLEKALDAYANIIQQHPHYYPAVNYAYTYVLLDALAGENNLSKYDTPEFYFDDEDIQQSFEENSYYARISKAEFSMLLGKPVEADALNTILNDTAYTEDMIKRTLRQLDFFKDILETYADQTPPEGFQILYDTLNTKLAAT
jgi:hypothetical protein